MMNKKKLCIIIVIAIIVTGLAVTFAVLSKTGTDICNNAV